MTAIAVPPALAAFHTRFYGAAGDAWIAALPERAAAFLDRWQLRLDGPARHGMVALVLPVLRSDGTPAVLKLQPVDPDHPGEGAALGAWDGDGAVRLLDEDPESWTLLLERLDPARSLNDMPDDLAAVQVISELLVRLNAHPAPPGVRTLREVAEGMLAAVPDAAAQTEPDLAKHLGYWAAAVAEVLGEPADRLLHWDLHYENVLAGDREPWLAIDPKPLSGHPGFELLPAIHNRWPEIVASGDIARAVRRRFDLMTEVLDLDRPTATAWTLGRVLQNALWAIEDDEPLHESQVAVAEALTR